MYRKKTPETTYKHSTTWYCCFQMFFLKPIIKLFSDLSHTFTPQTITFFFFFEGRRNVNYYATCIIIINFCWITIYDKMKRGSCYDRHERYNYVKNNSYIFYIHLHIVWPEGKYILMFLEIIEIIQRELCMCFEYN